MSDYVFPSAFTSPAYDGETLMLEVDGFTVTATIHDDPDMAPPWEAHDGHGDVTGWLSRDKRPGELELSRSGDGGAKRFYDFAGACAIARRDGWGADPRCGVGETARQYAARAALADFQWLKRWVDDEWRWVGVAVTVERAGVALTGEYDHAIWGVDSESADHLTDLANERIGEAVDAARAKIAELAA